MIILNPDQLRAKEFIKNWWDSDKRFAILEGCAGTGKTTIVKDIVAELKNCDPLFTSPTNEACRQLEIALPKGSLIRTTYSALGFHFDTSEEKAELKQRAKEQPVINDCNLLIIDEASMVGQELLDAIFEVGKKTLFIGHRSQLPEVVVDLKAFDDCESVVFKQSYPIYTLTTPEWNKGELFDFIHSLEKLITTKPRIVRNTYNMGLDELMDYIDSTEGSHDFLYERSKFICWTNKEADLWNNYIRKCIFNTKFPEPFLPKDKIILTSPCVFVEPLVGITKGRLDKFAGSDKIVNFTANTKAIVRKVGHAVVLGVPCFELEVETEVEGKKLRPLLYVAIDKAKVKALSNRLKFECWGKTTTKAREKAFRNYHFAMSIFANVKHSYAITTHRSQGMTIAKVYVSWKDIKKCDNVVLRYKMLYVAASRAKEHLSIIN